MSYNIWKETRLLKIFHLAVLALVLLAFQQKDAMASRADQFLTTSTGQAFAIRPVPSVRGTRVGIWTANHPSGYIAIAGLTGICTHTTCDQSQGIFETGFVKGTITPVDNQLQQYAAYKNTGSGSSIVNVFGLGNLNNNSWYTFQSLFSNTAQRWEAWRGTSVVYYVNLNFTTGALAVCGAEGIGTVGQNPPLGTQCENMRYKVGSGGWTSYDYTSTQISGPYCVYRPHQYAAIGWGPC